MHPTEQGERPGDIGDDSLSLLMHSVTDYALILIGTDGRVAGWGVGAERILGRREEEIVGRPFGELFPPEEAGRGEPEAELRQAEEQGRADDNGWLARGDGGRVWVSGVTAALRAPDRALRGYVKIVRDRAEPGRVEEALKQADRRRDEFLAMLSHELRNPLAPVLNSLHVLRQLPADAPEARQATATMERQVRHLARLVDDLLDVSRLTLGKVRIRPERVDLRAAAEAAAETCRPRMDAHRHRLSVTAGGEPLWVDADPTRLEQVVTNLLNNAAKYTPDGGRVWLEVGREGGEAVLRVRDTGVGIAPEMLGRVFDLFAQADGSLDRAQGGLGIGLTLVRGLVGLHGGRVEARSDGPGQGSEFVVRLPARAAERSTPAASAPAPAGARRLRILAVDDNRDMADSVAMLLGLGGHEVRAAYSGPEALAAACEFRPDLVLLDVGLPGMSGVAVAAELRARDGFGDLPIVAMTGHSRAGAGVDPAAARVFDRVLVKPVDPEQFQGLLADVVARNGRAPTRAD